MDRFLETAGLGSVSGWLKRRRKTDETFEPGGACANCQVTLQGPWCHACGQGVEDHHRSVWKLIVDGFESLFHADGRLWRTLPDLVWRPGRLTRQFLDGRRAPQVPPFRMFLVVLLIVFFTGHLSTSRQEKSSQGAHSEGVQVDAAEAKARLAEARNEIRLGAGPKAEEYFTRGAKTVEGAVDEASERSGGATVALGKGGVIVDDGDSRINLDGDRKSSNAAEAWLQPRIDAIKKNPEQFGLILEIWAHRVAILALPLSALLLGLVYVFQRRFYIFDHLIFSMHSLSFQGLLLSLIFLLSLVVGDRAWILLLIAPVHLFFHLRGAYGSSVFGTLVRMVILFAGTAFGFGLLAGLWLLLGMNQMAGAH